MLKVALREPDSMRLTLLALAIFAYALVIAATIQFLILPRIFPAWHAGHGLIAGGDMPGFHRLAVELAEKIQTQGWSAWELRPAGQAPAGIAGALYVLVAPEPWTVIPLNATLHALAGVLLVRIFLYFDPRWTVAVIGALPLVLFPSAATWYSQLGKDGFSIAGYLAIVLGWITVVQFHNKPHARHVLSGVLLILGGGILVWIVRPYAVEILLALSLIAAAVLVIVLLARILPSGFQWKWVVLALAAATLVLFAFMALVSGGFEPELPVARAGSDTNVSSESGTAEITFVWTRTRWIPEPVDKRIYSLAVARKRFTTLFPEAGSNLDVNTSFQQATDVIKYIPRATAIAFLYPVPFQWLQEGSIPQNTLMRRIAGPEMAAVYLALVMLPYAIWRWRRRLETWLALLFGVGMLIALALVVANLGTLYRMRYPYLMTLVGLSVAAATALYLDWRVRKAGTNMRAAAV